MVLQADVEASTYHTSRLVSTAALDVMTTQRDVIYTAKAETRVKLHKLDKAALGLTLARLVEDGGPPTKVGTSTGACAPYQLLDRFYGFKHFLICSSVLHSEQCWALLMRAGCLAGSRRSRRQGREPPAPAQEGQARLHPGPHDVQHAHGARECHRRPGRAQAAPQ